MRLDEISSSLKSRAAAASEKKWRNSASELDSVEKNHGKTSPKSDAAFKKYSRAGDQMSRLGLAHAKSDPLAEGPFDDMVNDLTNSPKKGPGRWPGAKEKKHPGVPYSGDRANDRNDLGGSLGPSVKRSKELGQLNGPSPSRIKRVKETTGDEKFDNMINNISGSDSPQTDLGSRKTQPDRKTMELTHKIFLALRDYDDPYVYDRFVEFMAKTLDPNIGSVDN
jgi:hypothetical protein